MHSPYPLSAEKPLSEKDRTLLWNDIHIEIREAVGETNFELWFTGFQISHIEKGEVTLLASGSIYALWVDENFKGILLSIFPKYIDPLTNIRIDYSEEAEQEMAEMEASTPEETKKPEILVETISESKLLERGQKAGLVPKFDFENFVVGENSELAWAASQAVANHPGKAYQPLFFHSACGLGKTHLLHAIGWESLRQRPSSKVIFVSAEHFGNDYIHAIQNHSLEAFRKKYREADLLMIDDIQFLGRKDGFQKEFFHTFNMLADRQKQIVLASDCPASEISELEERLSSRFQSGMSAEIYRPGLETRAAILRRKRDDWKMAVSDELIDAIVEHVRGNVRVLEGSLIRVAMVATMNEESIEPGDVGEILADICGGAESANVGMEEIKRAVCEHYDLEHKVLIGKKRTARVAEARQVAMFLCRTMTELSLMDIAAGFGKDHGTVIYAVKKIRKKCETSNSLKSTVELIKRRLVRGGSVKSTTPSPDDYRKRG
ncbi:MAG: chromosomal replication initiator protein DnaA [Verrucomicrobiales bacterium]|nr:chromosomal replication initiator protein DnaA [Verrucomicrobiales bacterium]